MIKEKSKNRLAKLEQRRPSTHSEGSRILITEEARELLLPWEEALERLDGKRIYYPAPKSTSGCIYENTPDEYSIVVSEKLWYECVGTALAMVATENDFAIPDAERPPDTRSMPKQDIDARVAAMAIKDFKKYGITTI